MFSLNFGKMVRPLALLLAVCAGGVSGAAEPADAVRLEVSTDRESARYRVGETVTFRVAARRGDQPVTAGKVSYELKKCARSQLVLGSGELELGAKPVEFTATLPEPGFLYFRVSGKFDGKTVQDAAGAAFDPEKIMPLQQEAADFDAFWAEGLARQAKCPPVELEKLDRYSTPEYTSYLVKVPAVDGSTIYGYLSEPNRPGRYPAVVHLPGAGAGYRAPATEWPAEGVIALRMNVHTYRPADTAGELQKQFREAYGTKLNYLRQNSDDRERHVYRRAHLAISRAIDFVASRPNFDGKHFVSYGSSQGGTLGMAMAGLNPHLTAMAAMVPGFGDHAGFLVGRSNSHLLIPFADDPVRLEKAKAVAGCYDSAFWARRIRIPVLVSVGFIDPTCTPASVYTIYNQLPGPKRIIEYPKGTHGLPPPMRREMMAFVRQHLEIPTPAEEAAR